MGIPASPLMKDHPINGRIERFFPCREKAPGARCSRGFFRPCAPAAALPACCLAQGMGAYMVTA